MRCLCHATDRLNTVPESQILILNDIHRVCFWRRRPAVCRKGSVFAQPHAARHIMLWMSVWNKVTFSLNGKHSRVSECCLSSSCTQKSQHASLDLSAFAIMFLWAKINYGGQTQYQMKKGYGGNHMWRRARIQRCLYLCHWICIDNHIKEANGVADSNVEMFPRG